MRVLFSAETPLSLTSFQSVIRELTARGHEVVVGFHEDRERGGRDNPLAEILRDSSKITVESAVQPEPDDWLELSSDIRSSLDLFQVPDPRDNETDAARPWDRPP